MYEIKILWRWYINKISEFFFIIYRAVILFKALRFGD
jgi:hypothetical protein